MPTLNPNSLLNLTLPDLWLYLLTALAIYRASSMVMEEDGPFHLFKRWRKYLYGLGARWQWVAEGFSCFYCLSFWASLVLSVCIVQRLNLGLVVVWLSLAGTVQLYRRYEDRQTAKINVARYAATKSS